MKIAVLFGGLSKERSVSINGGKAVINALIDTEHDVIGIDPALGINFEKSADILNGNLVLSEEDLSKISSRSYIDCINSSAFDDVDCAFIVLHGTYGEDGRVQALLELRGIPFTGSGVMASSLAMNKEATKMVFAANGVLTPDGLLVNKSDWDNFDLIKEMRSNLGDKLVVKPNEQGSTIGLTIIKNGNLDDISHAIKLACEYSKSALVEKYIAGRELTVGVVGDSILPVIEIVPEDGFYDFEHKYTKGKTHYICPADLSPDIEEFMMSMAEIAYKSLGCEGFGRVDFRLDDDGQPFCLEVNTVPGFTELSLVPMAAKEIGIEFKDLCLKLIEIALNKRANNE